MRVPTGDAVHRAYAAQASSVVGGGELVVVEIENASTLPFAVAFAVRPYTAAGLSRIERIALEGPVVIVDGRPALVLPSVPPRVAASTSSDGDCATVVLSGGAGTAMPERLRDRAGMAQAAFVFPLAHTATIRVVIPLQPSSRRRSVAVSFPTALPSAEQVASGWAVQTERGLQLVLPDPKVQDAVDACRRHLLVVSGDGATSFDVVATLDRFGFHDEAAQVLATFPDRCRRVPAAALGALAEHWRLTRDRSLLRDLAGPIAHAAEQVARHPHTEMAGAVRMRDAALLLDALDERRAAADARRVAEGMPAPAAVEAPLACDQLAGLLASASPTWTWPDATLSRLPGEAAADLLSAVRAMLVDEVDAGIALCASLPVDWMGRGIEVHDAPTAYGTLSYAVRWHGARPALLWELVAHDDVGEVALTAPGLDPTWRTTDRKGDALLEAPAPSIVAEGASFS
jgi:hypothetical protein